MRTQRQSVETRWDEGWVERAVDAEALWSWLDETQGVLALRRELLLVEGQGGEKERADLGRALQLRARALGLAGRWEEALEARVEQLAVWQALGRDRAIFVARLHLAEALDMLDRHDEADALLDELGRAVQQDEALAPYRDALALTRATVLARRGERVSAARWLERAIATRQRRGNARAVEALITLRERLREG